MVLVLVGLVIGGVLVGKDLVFASQVRAQVSQIERLSTGISTFTVKYNYLPGDIPTAKATEYGFPTDNPFVDNGNGDFGDGNGQITGQDGLIPATSPCCEPYSAYWQLNGLGLFTDGIDKTKSYYELAYWPQTKLNPASRLFLTSYQNAVWFFIGLNMEAMSGWIGHFNGTPGSLTPKQAYALDVKMDDGVPGTGTVFASDQLTGNGIQALDTTANQCVTTSAATAYNTSGNQANVFWCRLFIKMR